MKITEKLNNERLAAQQEELLKDVKETTTADIAHAMNEGKPTCHTIRENDIAVGLSSQFKYVEKQMTPEGIVLFTGNTKEELEQDKNKFAKTLAENGGSMATSIARTWSAEEYVEAGYIPEKSVTIRGVELVIKGKEIRNLQGDLIANANDLQTNSKEAIEAVLVARAEVALIDEEQEGDYEDDEDDEDNYDDEED